jgi:hypothetical protein
MGGYSKSLGGHSKATNVSYTVRISMVGLLIGKFSPKPGNMMVGASLDVELVTTVRRQKCSNILNYDKSMQQLSPLRGPKLTLTPEGLV